MLSLFMLRCFRCLMLYFMMPLLCCTAAAAYDADDADAAAISL